METQNLNSYLKAAIISFAASILAYFLLFLINNLIVLYFAYDFDIGAFFNMSGLTFYPPKPHKLWTFDAEVTIYLSAPLLSLSIGIIALTVLLLIKKIPKSLYFFFLWLNIFSFNACFGTFIDDFIAQSGTTDIAKLMQIDIVAMIFSVIISAFMLYRVGMLNSSIFSSLLTKKCNSKLSIRAFAVFLIILIPYLLAFTFIVALSLNSFDIIIHLKSLSILIIIIPMFYCSKKQIRNAKAGKIDIKTRDFVISIIFILLTTLLYYIISNDIYIVKPELL